MILRDSAFEADPWGGGGRKRTAQISDILLRHGLDGGCFISCPQLMPDSLLAAGNSTGRLQVGNRSLVLPLGDERSKELRAHLAQCKQALLDASAGTGCLLLENTRSGNYFTIPAAREAGLNVVALPHNLESLVPSQRSLLSGRMAPEWLIEEIALLSMAHSVYAISREEQWLLRLHGIDARYLPYYPPEPVAGFLSGIHDVRNRQAVDDSYLLLGTVGNPPTLQGMVALISEWPRVGRGQTLHVAGFHTEQLARYVRVGAETCIELHGTLSNGQLAGLLAAVRAVILHQPPTSGALTRIPELLLAGVPVLANRDAARNAHDVGGVSVYDDLPGLQLLLEQAELSMPAAPPLPERYETGFVEVIRAMSAASR